MLVILDTLRIFYLGTVDVFMIQYICLYNDIYLIHIIN